MSKTYKDKSRLYFDKKITITLNYFENVENLYEILEKEGIVDYTTTHLENNEIELLFIAEEQNQKNIIKKQFDRFKKVYKNIIKQHKKMKLQFKQHNHNI